ncbi:uncharacterized protein N7458_008884 [Penicillium daleae]|uniref:Uncharacterized protein n=1 Tax=Penicillium daleae TaxID=63821 RepID=A0AAD6BY57_9EURO|nr:uncharacterized protein N7458_008884 [Penicillium daleae]KAJ5437886.1 hypothetical protein N7458_008884 [Penicillium daleae]
MGSLIVKQSLCVANKQFSWYGSTVNFIAGAIFLSTPHRYGDKITNLLVNREACLTHALIETIIGLNLDYFKTCLFTKSTGSEGLLGLNKFINKSLVNSINLVALRFKEQPPEKSLKLAKGSR